MSGTKLRKLAGDDEYASQIADLWLQTQTDVATALQWVEWAEDEIQAAIARHPAQADLLFHAFQVIRPGDGFRFPPHTEFVWRGHFREQLDRVAAEQDTRPATWAEICLLMSAASQKAPLRSPAVGLYIKAWARAFPGVDGGMGELAGELAHYERMEGAEMDTLEREARRAVANRNGWRRLPKDLTCDGTHWGDPAPGCQFIPGTLDGLPDPRAPRRRKPARSPATPKPGSRHQAEGSWPDDEPLALFDPL